MVVFGGFKIVNKEVFMVSPLQYKSFNPAEWSPKELTSFVHVAFNNIHPLPLEFPLKTTISVGDQRKNIQLTNSQLLNCIEGSYLRANQELRDDLTMIYYFC